MKFKYYVEYPYSVKAVGRTKYGYDFIGVAKCHPNDDFDINKGKKIARLRATERQLKKIIEITDIQTEPLAAELDKILNQLNKMQKRIYKTKCKKQEIEKEIKELTKEWEN